MLPKERTKDNHHKHEISEQSCKLIKQRGIVRKQLNIREFDRLPE